MAVQLTFTEFLDFVLIRLYELDRESGSNRWVGHDVEQIAAELREPVPPGWVEQVIEVLRHRGLADAGNIDGVMGASISGEGRLYVEGRRHESTVIDEYRQQPTNFVVISGTGNQVAVGVQGQVTQILIPEASREHALKLISEAREILNRDEDLDATTRRDALADVDAIEDQFKRKRLNKPAVAALLGNLAEIATVTEVVVKLGELVQHIT